MSRALSGANKADSHAAIRRAYFLAQRFQIPGPASAEKACKERARQNLT